MLQKRVWQACEVPNGANVVTSKWVFWVKRNADGTIHKFKTRLVARGFTQQQGVDFFEVYAPVAKHSTLRLILSAAVMMNMEVRQSDVATAYLNANVVETVYMQPPPGVRIFQTKEGVLETHLDFDSIREPAQGGLGVQLKKSVRTPAKFKELACPSAKVIDILWS